jgi:hypothetical protein
MMPRALSHNRAALTIKKLNSTAASVMAATCERSPTSTNGAVIPTTTTVAVTGIAVLWPTLARATGSEAEIREEDQRGGAPDPAKPLRHLQEVGICPGGDADADDEDEPGGLDDREDDRQADRARDSGVQHDRGDGEKGKGVQHHGCAGQVSKVSGEAERNRGRGEQIGRQHQPASHEASGRSEFGRVLWPQRREASIRVGGQAPGDSGEDEREPHPVSRLGSGWTDEGIDAGAEDDADAGQGDLPDSKRPP